MSSTHFAFDRQSARSFDADGRMRVKNCILSTAEVNPYYGREIPKWQSLGLDANDIYHLYRDPEELKRAAETFEGVPLMLKHIVQTADAPQKEYQAGSVHSVHFDGKHLRGDLLVTDGYAIELIEADELADLSCGYRYDPVMRSGEADGSKYDGVMRHIGGNHVALVDDGRATGAHVADHALRLTALPGNPKGAFDMPFEPKEGARPEGEAPQAAPPAAAPEQAEQSNMADFGAALKQIAVILEQQGQMLANIHARFGSDTAGADNEPEGEAREHEREGEEREARMEGANDFELQSPVREGSFNANKEGAADGEMDEGENAEVPLPPPDQEGTPARGGSTPHAAMDAKTARAVDAAIQRERNRMKAVRQAEADVRPFIGEVHGMDSAGDIYRAALEFGGVDVARVARGQEKLAFGAMVAAQATARGAVRVRASEHALDAKARDDERSALVRKLAGISVKG